MEIYVSLCKTFILLMRLMSSQYTIKMMRFQVILVFILFTLSSCQNDSTVQPPIQKTGADAKPIEKIVQKEEVDIREVKQDNLDTDPELIEFYVEEDKKETATEEIKKVDSPKAVKEVAVKKTTKPKKAPRIKFENNTFTFGTIKPGDVIEHKFEFTNTGDADLVITDAQATCGCTQPSFPFIPIAPGEKGFIGVKYDSTGKLGSQKPTVTITTNAYPKTQKVYLEGLVISKMSSN